MCCPFYDGKKWLGAPGILNEKKMISFWGLSLHSLFSWLFWCGRGDFCLEVEGQCPGGKVGLVRVEASCEILHLSLCLDVLGRPFFSLGSWAGSRDASGLVCKKHRAQCSLSLVLVIKIISFSSWSPHATLRPGPRVGRASSSLALN